MDKAERKSRIRALNDSLRQTFAGGRLIVTRSVQEMSDDARGRLLAEIKTFDAFDRKNDPYGEHDFGAVEIDGGMFFFKIDYFDFAMSQHSVDPANAEATMRVLTIMRADEY